MTKQEQSLKPFEQRSSYIRLLEQITGVVLVGVLLSLVWMVLASILPELGEKIPLQAQVSAVLAILSAALVMISLMALAHTAPRD